MRFKKIHEVDKSNTGDEYTQLTGKYIFGTVAPWPFDGDEEEDDDDADEEEEDEDVDDEEEEEDEDKSPEFEYLLLFMVSFNSRDSFS